jgi:hypothetical protein
MAGEGKGSMSVVHFRKTWVKIARHGENFWLCGVRTENGKRTGIVDNDLIFAPYKRGERIGFSDGEVLDFMTVADGEKIA